MATKALNKQIKKAVVFKEITSNDAMTLEEYRNEMQAAENSGFVSFEEHKKNMNQWLTEKLQ